MGISHSQITRLAGSRKPGEYGSGYTDADEVLFRSVRDPPLPLGTGSYGYDLIGWGRIDGLALGGHVLHGSPPRAGPWTPTRENEVVSPSDMFATRDATMALAKPMVQQPD